MLSRAHKHLTYANVAATLALLFAMSGAAYAANRYLITSTKQISPSVLKSLRGASGKTGPAGPPGAAGAGTAGPQGPAGNEGSAGKEGKEGKEGKPGKNGTTGFTETLPSGKTETGAWSFGPIAEASVPSPHLLFVPVASFAIPLAKALSESQVHYINPAGKEINGSFEEVAPTECGSGIGPGVNAENPQAKPGNLCVYAATETFAKSGSELILNPATRAAGAGTTGASMDALITGPHGEGLGTWAVTAE